MREESIPASRSAKADRVIESNITYLAFQGIINHTFGGRKLAPMARTQKMVLNLKEVTRISSSGMAAWMAFLRANQSKQIYIVECSAYVMNQYNQMAGLFGNGKVVSFYAPYRCTPCDSDFFALVLVPRDRVAIRDRALTDHACPNCGQPADLDDDPNAFFGTVAQEPVFDLDDELEQFLQAKLNYNLTPDKSRFRGGFLHEGDYTYLRLTGKIDRSLPPEAIARCVQESNALVDVSELSVADSGGVAQWRALVRTGLATASMIELVNCPLGFLDATTLPEDLGEKMSVHSFAMPYRCVKCGEVGAQMIRVADHFAKLVASMALDLGNCPACKSQLAAAPSDTLHTLMRAFPRRDRDARAMKLIVKSQEKPFNKLINCLTAGDSRGKVPVSLLRSGYMMIGLATLILGVEVVVAVRMGNGNDKPEQVVVEPKKPDLPERPGWIVSDVGGAAYCHDLINRFMCIGVSSMRKGRDEGVAEATDAALDEFVQNVSLKIADPFFQRTVAPLYQKPRGNTLTKLDAAETTSAAGSAAKTATSIYDTVAQIRHRVVDVLKSSGGIAVPARYSDWYWEEYKKDNGPGTEFKVFVRFDINIDTMKALVDRYSTATEAAGLKFGNVFPAVAWKYNDLKGGAVLMSVPKALESNGVTEGSIVVAVGDHEVQSADDLAKQLASASRPIKLSVRTGDAAPRVVELP